MKMSYYKVMSSETNTNNNQCQQCSKSFASEEELTQHMNQEHVGNVLIHFPFFSLYFNYNHLLSYLFQ